MSQHHLLSWPSSTIPASLTSLLLGCTAVLPAFAQDATVAAANQSLPPIVVEGATMDAITKPAVQKQKGAASASEGSDKSEPSKKAPQPPNSGSAEGAAQDVPTGQAADAGGAGSTDGDGEMASGVAARKLGIPVSVVTGAELRAQQIRNAADALRSLPGVAVSSAGSGGQLTQVRIRGAEGNQTLVIIDGVEANDTNNGEFDFSNLAADDIERIEVIRGGMSGLYGSRAIGGIVNIITRGGKGPLTFRGRVEGGSFGTSDVAGSVSAGNDRGYFAVGLSRRGTNGFNIAPEGTEDDGFDRTTFNLRAGASIVEGISVDFNLRRTTTLSDYDAFGGPDNQLQTAQDSPNTSDAKLWLGGGKLTWDMFDGGLTQVVGGNFNSSIFQSTDPFSTVTYDNNRDRFYYLGTARFAMPELAARHIISGLVEKQHETFTPDIPFFTDNVERERGSVAYAAEYRGEYLDRFFPYASVRHEDNDTFADFTTWKTALSVPLNEIGMRPHASAGTAVALPGMFEQFGAVLGTFIGNPNLVPEESFGWDAGVEFTLLPGKAVVDVTYFQADLTNEIVGFGQTLINLPGTSQRKGIEVAARAEVMPGVVVGAAYTWLDASDSTGLAEVRRPANTARFDVNYVFDQGRGNLNVAAIYNGETPDVAFFFDPNPPPIGTFGSTFVQLDAYWLVNVAASYKVAPGVELYGRVENLLNEDYQEVYGYETAGLAAYAGLRFTYEEVATRAWAEGH